jgi:hypothetical protein
MSDDAMRRFTKRAKDFLEEARRQLKEERDGGGWTAEPDFGEVNALANIALNLAMNEERLGSVPVPQQLVERESIRHFICGFHFPGHLDEAGAPVVCLLPSGVRRMMPPDALPVSIIIPPGREAEILKTYPEAK